jgi:hypothetical protein
VRTKKKTTVKDVLARADLVGTGPIDDFLSVDDFELE